MRSRIAKIARVVGIAAVILVAALLTTLAIPVEEWRSVEHLPFEDNTFDKALAINSMQVWPDAVAGLREMRRVLKAGAGIALGFTSYSGQTKRGLPELLLAAGFVEARVVESDQGFCALAIKP